MLEYFWVLHRMLTMFAVCNKATCCVSEHSLSVQTLYGCDLDAEAGAFWSDVCSVAQFQTCYCPSAALPVFDKHHGKPSPTPSAPPTHCGIDAESLTLDGGDSARAAEWRECGCAGERVDARPWAGARALRTSGCGTSQELQASWESTQSGEVSEHLILCIGT